MKIYISDKKEIRTVTLREWEGGNWSQDMFQDMACNYRTDYPINPDNEDEMDCFATMTEQQYNEEVKWWRDECRKYNNHDPNSWFVEPFNHVDEEFARGAEMILNWD